ncbi:hypothetical protein IPdc08_00844 [archaeon]|nr:hypothetical protein IPdc08_00844 [archaeon]
MQKLLVEFKNTSGAPPQAHCSVSEILNREKTSVPRIVLANNSSKEDQHSGKSGQYLRVPVINMQKQPIPDSSRNSEQVEFPTGLDRIKIIIFKEVKRTIPQPIEMGSLIVQIL